MKLYWEFNVQVRKLKVPAINVTLLLQVCCNINSPASTTALISEYVQDG